MPYTPVSPEDCPIKESHGNPFLYCAQCTWIEEEKPVPGRPPVPVMVDIAAVEAVPAYVMDLVRALKSGDPLNFQGHKVPQAVQDELAKHDWTSAARHNCIIDVDLDHLAYRTQYLIGCQCHEGNTKHIWQPGDAPYVCPTSGVMVEDPSVIYLRNNLIAGD